MAHTGDSLAAALIDKGIRSCREAGGGDFCGVFCGMGVCSECAVVVDGVPGRLACMTAVADGMTVEMQPPVALTDVSVSEIPEDTVESQLLVIGAGPAGLTAAAEAAEAGIDVVVVDERSKLGGQFFKQPAPVRTIDDSTLDQQFLEGRNLIERVQKSGAKVELGVTIWGAFDTDLIYGVSPERRFEFRAQRVIVSSGAYERGVPMPGWTMPGVMTTGAAQTLTRSNQVSPGTKVLVAGNGPLNLQVAAELTLAGVEVVALVEAADTRWWTNLVQGAAAFIASPRLVERGLKYRRILAASDVPTLHHSVVIGFTGGESVENALVAPLDADDQPIREEARHFDVDAVCVGYGFIPSSEIARSLGCRHIYDDASGTLVVDRDESGRTSLSGVWVIGDSGGVNGAYVAKAQGVLAAAEVALEFEKSVPSERIRTARGELVRNERFQRSLNKIYSAKVFTHQLADAETVVCRCETVTMSEIQESMDQGIGSPGALKRVTRAGMGKCQGRYCSPVMTALAHEKDGRTIDEFSGFAPRPPLRPVPVQHAASASVDPIELGKE